MLAGGITFTKLDMSQAYQQLTLNDSSKKVVTINTHKGLFCYQRLPFRVSSAPGIFQRTMESLLQGLRLHKDKCEFMVPVVKYLGHVIDAKGLHPAADKLKAVREAPTPQNVTELGLLSCYSKFLPNMAITLVPLYRLLCNNVKWQWTPLRQRLFKHPKNF